MTYDPIDPDADGAYDTNELTVNTLNGLDLSANVDAPLVVDGQTVFSAGVDIPNLLGYYSFDDDSNASIVVDDSINGHNGTINSGASYTTDSKYGANALDCSTPDVNFGTNLPFDNEWAIAFWVKTTSNSQPGDSPPAFVTKGDDEPYIAEFTGEIRIRNASGYGSKQSTVDVSTGNYEHIIVNAVNGGDTTEVYKNNSLGDTLITSGQNFDPNDDFKIGGRGDAINFKIDELYVFNQSLSSAQRTDIFNDTLV